MEIPDTLKISVYIGSDDYKLFGGIVNRGIDARLTAFTKSSFHQQETSRLNLHFHNSEIEILLRRLSELSDSDENADSWETDIISAAYGIEIDY